MMSKLTRRDAIGSVALGAAALAVSDAVIAAVPPTATRAFAGLHQPRPLPFDPAKLSGLSERLIQSHWANNYQGSVKALNLIEGRLP